MKGRHARVSAGWGSRPAPSRRLRRGLGTATAGVALLGLVAEVAYYRLGAPAGPVELLSLSFEANLPTWYASSLLLCCGLLLGRLAMDASSKRDHLRIHWWGLSMIFVYMSLDEAVEIHEHLGLLQLEGVLYFSWIVPAAIVVGIVGIFYLPFLKALTPGLRRRFMAAGAVYVSGALLMELPLGYWTWQAGDDNLTYALLDFVEETMELAGASLFLVALWEHWSAS